MRTESLSPLQFKPAVCHSSHSSACLRNMLPTAKQQLLRMAWGPLSCQDLCGGRLWLETPWGSLPLPHQLLQQQQRRCKLRPGPALQKLAARKEASGSSMDSHGTTGVAPLRAPQMLALAFFDITVSHCGSRYLQHVDCQWTVNGPMHCAPVCDNASPLLLFMCADLQYGQASMFFWGWASPEVRTLHLMHTSCVLPAAAVHGELLASSPVALQYVLL